MTPLQLKELFRTDSRDEAQPYLWSDAEIYSYMDDAQKMFCRKGGGIADSITPAITQIAVVAGSTQGNYDPRILKLRDLRRASDGQNVEIINFEDLGHAPRGTDDYGHFAPAGGGPKFSTRLGPVRAVVIGMDASAMRFIDVPEADDMLLAIVYRMPLEDVTESTLAFEIDTQHHLHLMGWMKHLAHKKQDAETYDRGRSLEFRDEFLAYCDQAKAEREQREHKYRSVTYGGL